MFSPTSITNVRLSEEDVHVWMARTDLAGAEVARLCRTLSVDEIARAEQFRFDQHRVRFVAARGLLRTILAGYLSVAPADIIFEYGPYGKPFLTAAVCDAPIRFNVSHAHDIALYAITYGREVGVDVEFTRVDKELETAEQLLSPMEQAVLQRMPAAKRRLAFFTCWTRKESYLKARGEGLSFPLDHFDVTVSPDESPELFRVLDNPGEIDRWSLCDLTIGGGYVAAITVEGPRLVLVPRHFSVGWARNVDTGDSAVDVSGNIRGQGLITTVSK
jgi:4'-phosphopantetheinyl transferase